MVRVWAAVVSVSGVVVLVGGTVLPATLSGFVVWPVLLALVGSAVVWKMVWRRHRGRGWPAVTPLVALVGFVALWALVSGPQLAGSSGQTVLALTIGAVAAAWTVACARWVSPPVGHGARTS